MTPDVTIKISFDSNGTASSTEFAAADGLPSPINLDALEGAAAVAAPSPLSAAELATAQGQAQGQVAAGEEPVPMAIEQLVTSSSAAAPAPEALGALTAVGGAPAPQSLEQLGAVGEGEAPPPLDVAELEAAAKPAARRSTR